MLATLAHVTIHLAICLRGRTRLQSELPDETKGAPIRILSITLLLPLLLALPAGRGWERPRLSAREQRIAWGERWEHVRLALRSAAIHGYYVFEGLMTENAGMIDFLAVGPLGACVVVVRDEDGDVTADTNGALYLDGRRFEDDPKSQADEQGDDVSRRLRLSGVQTHNIICFMRAELYYLGDDPDEVLKGVCPTWDLPLSFSNAPTEHTPADVAEIADRVQEVYGRPPFVVPGGADAP